MQFLLMEDTPVVNKGGFSDNTCSNYRSMLSSCIYYMEDFYYRSILFDNGDNVHWYIMQKTVNESFPFSRLAICCRYSCCELVAQSLPSLANWC